MSRGLADSFLRYQHGMWVDCDGDPVEIELVVHAHWVHDINNLYGCSVCMERETMSPKKMKKFCPHCGAHMDEEVS